MVSTKICECGCGNSPKRGRFMPGHNLQPFIPIMVRFEKQIERVTESGCWIWTGQICNGYGYIKENNKNRLVHRVAWELFRGPISDRVDILHHCDTPCCANPYHLFKGTAKENMSDCISKQRFHTGFTDGRQQGEKNHGAKLSEEDIKAIRSDKRIQREIAKDYEVSRAQIGRIKQGTSWAHI